MKTKSSLLLILFAAFFLTSCGAKKTAATFEVSTSALSVNNSTYTGGLVIRGSSKSGSFTIPVPTGTGSGNSVTLDLPRDTWTFSAVGWAGALAFSGDSKCGSQTVDLNQDEQTVNLAIDFSKCVTESTVFGDSTYRSGNSFIDLSIVTCGWLYETDGTTPVSPASLNTFCAGADAKYRNWPASIKVEIPQTINGVVTAGISRCLSTHSNGIYSPTNLNLPSKGVPFVFSLHNQNNCSEGSTISKFNFSDGIDSIYGDHDSFFNKRVSDVRLFLPSYDTKRGYSSLLAQKPFPLLCSGASCFGIPATIPSAKNRIIRPGSEFVVTGTPLINQTCDKLTAGFSVSGISFSSALSLSDLKSNCQMKDGQMILRLHYSSFSASPSLTLTFDGGVSINLTFAEDPSYDAHQLAWELVGFPAAPEPTTDVKNSFAAFFDYKEESGLMTEVREMMGPEGAGGILGAGLGACVAAAGVSYITFDDEGESKTYKIEIGTAAATPVISAFQNDGSASATTNNPYQKRIRISKEIAANTYSTEMVLHFNCGYSVGRFEKIHTKPGKVEKSLIEWNTQTAISARVREIRYEEETTGSQITRFVSSYRYAEAPAATNKIYGRVYELEMKWTGAGTNFNFFPRSSQIGVFSSDSGFRHIRANLPFNTADYTDNVDYVTNIVAEENSPTALTTENCINKTAFAVSGTCSTPTTLSPTPFNGTWNWAFLHPSSIKTIFSSF